MSSLRHFALIIACDTHNDKKLAQLKAPLVDATRLAKILEDPSIGGGYKVKVLHNASAQKIRTEIEGFFTRAEQNDLLLLYFAGHGHKSLEDGLLYLGANDSDLEYLQ